jgi:hypothetical protein
MHTSASPVLLVGVITAIDRTTGSNGTTGTNGSTGERTIELYTDLGPVDVIVGVEHDDETFVLDSPALLPVALIDGCSGSELRWMRQDVAASALQTA